MCYHARRPLNSFCQNVILRHVNIPGRQLCRIGLLACVASFASLLLSVPGVLSAQDDAAATLEAIQGHQVWSATMGVGDHGDLLGYGTFSGRAVGALTNDSFSWRDTTYTVTNLVYNRSRGDAETWNVLINFSPALPDGIQCLTLQLGENWLNLADARGNNRQFLWYDVELSWHSGARVPVNLREFPPALEPRSIDGWGNNPNQPELGMADTKLLRLASVSFTYGMSATPPSDLPEARFISNALSAQSQTVLNTAQATDMLWQWGQFLDHDISLTPEGDPAEPFPILVPRGDPVFDPLSRGRHIIPFHRSAFDPNTGTGPDNPREQVNKITAFIDASNVYGSEGHRTRALRTNDGTGKLRTSGGGLFLPYNVDGFENDGGNERVELFFAGDIRANEQVGLTALHTLFIREHNRLADILASENPQLNGHEIFELARKIVGAQMQVITYNEFLTLLLGPGAIGPYDGYDSEADPTISNEFSTAAYRFGHSMLSPNILHVAPSGTEQGISLREAFFNPQLLTEMGLSGLLRGLARQQAQEVDLLLVDGVRNLLFGEPGGPGRDLAALNIQRGRDHGIPDYNSARGAYGLPPAKTFADVSSDPNSQDALSRVYDEVQHMDLWTGGLSEDHLPGAMVGETFHNIITEQFRRLRDGDRYWFENDPYFLANPGMLTEIRATTLADVIRRNTPIGDEVPDNVFGGPQPVTPPDITVEPDMTSISEGEALKFTLIRTGATEEELSINIHVTETGAMLSDTQVYTWQVKFDVGDDTSTLTLTTHDDAVVEYDSTVEAIIAEANGYHVATGASSATVIVKDNDSEEVRLEVGLTSFKWPGLDGMAIGDALQGISEDTDISDKVTAVYRWNEPAQTWLIFFPELEDAPGINTLTAFKYGRTYSIMTTESVTWKVAKRPLLYHSGCKERAYTRFWNFRLC